MKYLSLFSGVGGFELGINAAIPLATCIGYSEVDKYAINTYESHYEHNNLGDVTAINELQLPDFDLVVGGFPCQAFSVAGKRRGFNETRGTLFFDIARILKHKRPGHLVLENVKGLLSHDGGKTFTTIIGVLTDLGYDVDWEVLNAKNFGVPQNRERIFIVGHLRGFCRRKVFPLGRQEQPHTETSQHVTLGAQTISTRHLDRNGGLISNISPTVQASETPHIIGTINRDTFKQTSGISLTIPASYYKGADNHGARPVVLTALTPPGTSAAERVYAVDGLTPTLSALGGGGSGKTGMYAVEQRIRRLTPTECERLMSWPDSWTIGSDTQRYKQCGNGVVSNVVQAVIESMKECLKPPTNPKTGENDG